MGRSPQWLFSARRLIEASKSETCELVRIGSGVFSSETFSSISEESKCSDQTDNTTVMHYINKQGGTRSRPLCHMSWDLWNLVLKNNMQIKAAHIMGKRNNWPTS